MNLHDAIIEARKSPETLLITFTGGTEQRYMQLIKTQHDYEDLVFYKQYITNRSGKVPKFVVLKPEFITRTDFKIIPVCKYQEKCPYCGGPLCTPQCD